MKMFFVLATMTFSFAASAAEVPRDLRHEHVVCRSYLKTKLAQDDAITTTNFMSDVESERLSWKDGEAMIFESTGKITTTINEDEISKATYKSTRRTTSETIGDQVTEKSSVKMTTTSEAGAVKESSYETSTIYKVTATGKTAIRTYLDGREIPLHTFVDYSTTLFDGREVTINIEKTPYVSDVSPEGFITSILRSESTCVIDQK